MYTNRPQNNSHVNVFMGDLENARGQSKRSSIYAGNLKTVKNDRIETKISLAKKQAFKLVSKQFSNDIKMSDKINERHQNQEKLMAKAKDAYTEVNRIRGMKQELKDEYGITDDSKEHKDLELLQKSLRSPLSLSKEEKERLNEMGPLTDYQKKMLEYDSMEGVWLDQAEEAMLNKNMESKAIQGIKMALLKAGDPMVGVQKEASDIILQAGKEVIGLIYQDAIAQIDEKIAEEKEKAEKQKEKKEEAEEEKLKETDRQNTDTTSVEEEMYNQVDEMDELDRKLKSIAEQNAVTLEELKGIAVDEAL